MGFDYDPEVGMLQLELVLMRECNAHHQPAGTPCWQMRYDIDRLERVFIHGTDRTSELRIHGAVYDRSKENDARILAWLREQHAQPKAAVGRGIRHELEG